MKEEKHIMAKNKTDELRSDGLPADFANWETEKLGDFPPYFQPEEGLMFYATAVGVDYEDPEFHRIIFQAEADVECYRGPKDDQEPVTVKKGELFTCSAYDILSKQVGFLIMLQSGIVLKCVEKKQSKANPKQSYWTFELKVSPNDKKRLQAFRYEHSQRALGMSDKRTHEALPVSS